MNKFIVLRIIIGAFFAFSGFEKLMSPIENFQSVVESYEIINYTLSGVAAFILPWVELFLGVFLLLGFYLKWTLRGVFIMLVAFIFIVSQAIIRKLPIDECGCFGSLVTFPLHIVFMIDSTLLFLVGLLLYKINRTRYLSLDNYFRGRGVSDP